MTFGTKSNIRTFVGVFMKYLFGHVKLFDNSKGFVITDDFLNVTRG